MTDRSVMVDNPACTLTSLSSVTRGPRRSNALVTPPASTEKLPLQDKDTNHDTSTVCVCVLSLCGWRGMGEEEGGGSITVDLLWVLRVGGWVGVRLVLSAARVRADTLQGRAIMRCSLAHSWSLFHHFVLLPPPILQPPAARSESKRRGGGGGEGASLTKRPSGTTTTVTDAPPSVTSPSGTKTDRTSVCPPGPGDKPTGVTESSPINIDTVPKPSTPHRAAPTASAKTGQEEETATAPTASAKTGQEEETATAATPTTTTTTPTAPCPSSLNDRTQTTARTGTKKALDIDRAATVSPPPANEPPASAVEDVHAMDTDAHDGTRKRPWAAALDTEQARVQTTMPTAVTMANMATTTAGARSPPRGNGPVAKRSRVTFTEPAMTLRRKPSSSKMAFAKHAGVLRAVPAAIDFMLARIRDLEADVATLRARESNVVANAQQSERLVSEQLAKITSSIAALTEIKERVGERAVFQPALETTS